MGAGHGLRGLCGGAMKREELEERIAIKMADGASYEDAKRQAMAERRVQVKYATRTERVEYFDEIIRKADQ